MGALESERLNANIMSEDLRKVFVVALLLTGSAERAERSVLEAIKVVRPSQISASAVFRATIRIAVGQEMKAEEERSREQEPLVLWLPLELRHVLHLPRDDRHAFVLRLLLGLSREQCFQLLHLEDGEIDKHMVSAAFALTSIKADESHDAGMIGAVA